MKTVTFGPWTPWAGRDRIEGCGQPGVYLLGMFASAPPQQVDPLAAEVVYVGETCDALRTRWKSFHQSAFQGQKSHSGGVTFGSKFCNEGADRLHVAAFPVYMAEPYRSAYIRFVERRLIYDYVQKFNALPACNKK